MSALQIPDPSLAVELGWIQYLLVVVVLAGIGGMGFFLRRVVFAMDRMALAIESASEFRSKIMLCMERLEQKVDEVLVHARENARIAHMWERTDAPGRTVRTEPRKDFPEVR